MFQSCTSLQKAPKLPAETLVSGCYNHMFQDCTALNAVWMSAKYNLENGLNRLTFDGCPTTGVTAHISKDMDYDYKNNIPLLSYIGTLFRKSDWTYVDIDTGEAL